MSRRRVSAVLVTITVAVTTIATSASGEIRRQSGSTPSTTTTTLAGERCVEVGGVVASYPPTAPIPAPGEMPAGSTMSSILGTRQLDGRTIPGVLVVGVDENTLDLSSRDPITGEIKGFEVELARLIAAATTGSPDRIKLVTLTTDQKTPFVKDKKVDMTISVVSMSCSRWNADAAFSTAYYDAFQQLLVGEDSSVSGQESLPGKRVCVTEGSSSETFLKVNVPDAVRVPVKTRTACLVKLQDNKVDAVLLPSSILAGLHTQDPTTKLLPTPMVGTGATSTYGIAINHENRDLVRFVNALLERWRADGTLARLQEASFADRLPVHVPAPTYRSEP